MAVKRKTVVGRTKGIGESEAVPESKNFADPQADQDPLAGLRGRGLHVKGEPIEEWARVMPAEIVARMSYPLTDEGLEEQERIARDRDMRLPMGERAIDPDEKAILQYRDGLRDEDMVGLTLTDPLKAAMDKYLPKGHRGLFVGERKMRESGLLRGVVEYQKVLVPDEKGVMKEVRVGDMVLASVPEEVAARGDRYYQRLAEEKLVTPQEKVMERAEEVLSGRRAPGNQESRRRLLDRLNDRMNDDGDRADAELMQGQFGR